MAEEIWTYPVETKPQGDTALKVKKTKFGDGYQQKAGYGINAKDITWNIVVDNDGPVVKAAREFLDRHEGYIPFQWTPPGRTSPELFTCETYSESPHLANQNRLSATFERFYKP